MKVISRVVHIAVPNSVTDEQAKEIWNEIILENMDPDVPCEYKCLYTEPRITHITLEDPPQITNEVMMGDNTAAIEAMMAQGEWFEKAGQLLAAKYGPGKTSNERNIENHV